jgi:hypothetical protein
MNTFVSQPFHHDPHLKETIHVGWSKPPDDWIKLNSDGQCLQGRWRACMLWWSFSQEDGSNDILRRLEHVMSFNLKCGACTSKSDYKILTNMVINNCMISESVLTLVHRIKIFWLWIAVSKFIIHRRLPLCWLQSLFRLLKMY